MGSQSVACLFVIFLGLLSIGTCYECYSCFGADIDKDINIPYPDIPFTKGCLDPIDTTQVQVRKECSGAGESCVKIDMPVDNTDVVIRTCMPTTACAVFANCYTCNSDLCNSSSNMVPSVIFVSILCLAVAHFYL